MHTFLDKAIHWVGTGRYRTLVLCWMDDKWCCRLSDRKLSDYNGYGDTAELAAQSALDQLGGLAHKPSGVSPDALGSLLDG